MLSLLVLGGTAPLFRSFMDFIHSKAFIGLLTKKGLCGDIHFYVVPPRTIKNPSEKQKLAREWLVTAFAKRSDIEPYLGQRDAFDAVLNFMPDPPLSLILKGPQIISFSPPAEEALWRLRARGKEIILIRHGIVMPDVPFFSLLPPFHPHPRLCKILEKDWEDDSGETPFSSLFVLGYYLLEFLYHERRSRKLEVCMGYYSDREIFEALHDGFLPPCSHKSSPGWERALPWVFQPTSILENLCP